MIDCLVTIHGIGFQSEGYADNLHAHLKQVLGAALAPEPLYVTGHWPPRDVELSVLGTWDSAAHRTVTSTQPLGPDGTIVHIPLVYTDIQGTGLHPLATVEIAVQAAISLRNLATLQDLNRMGDNFVQLALHLVESASGSALEAIETRVQGAIERVHTAGGPGGQDSLTAVQGSVTAVSVTPQQRALLSVIDPQHLLNPIEDDIAMYVVRNDHRERVRSFVHDAILRLCFRADVRSVVINSHSNGTVIATDVLRQLPPAASTQVRALVTSGSPLRKYNDCFGWGTDFFLSSSSGTPIPQIAQWTNFWDPHDPVADPLNALFNAFDPQTGKSQPVGIIDLSVDNLKHSSGGGLQAHNYWDNISEWMPQMVKILRP
jgi:hypothetical protein